jgi:Na+/proline symporter
VVGLALWVFYRSFPTIHPLGRSDRIFPTFIVTEMPHGISGLLVAAILAAAMSNLSAALNSLSSSCIVDFYLRRKPKTSEADRLRLSRISTIAWGVVLFLLALLSRRGGRVVEVGLSIASVAYGAMLGVFLLGLLTREANERGAMVGMACGFAVELYVWLGTAIPWTWYVVIGTLATFGIGYIASLAFAAQEKPT